MTEAGKRLIEAARQARNIARTVRYYCRGERGIHGHCADNPTLSQCDHCKWEEQHGNYEDRIKNNC